MSICAVHPALAQGVNGATQNVTNAATAAGVTNTNVDLITVIGRVINILLGFVGIILLVLILYAGFLWMTAGGDATKIEKAKAYIRNAIIGLLIIACAWAIVRFVLGFFTGNGMGGGPGGGGSPGGGFTIGAGALGCGVLEMHFPERNAIGVPRNTAIIITFKKPIKISSIIQDYNDAGTPSVLTDDTVTEGINDSVVQIYQTSAGANQRLKSNEVRVRFTADRKSFVFRPVQPLGSATQNVGYTVHLASGLTGVLLENGTAAFGGGSCGQAYSWTFETNTTIDTTPPRVISVFPHQGTQVDRNAVINIQFSEAIDPTSATGFAANGFTNIETHAGGVNTQALDGEYRISNQYRSIEFIPSLACGMNTCGAQIFCLPDGGPQIDAVAHAATISGTGPQAQFLAAGYDGVVDTAGNSLDGNNDSITQGRGADDYPWTFGLSSNINLQPPIVEATIPSVSGENADPFAPIHIRFDSLLQPSTFNSDYAVINPHEPAEYADTFWWSTRVSDLTSSNQPIAQPTDIPAKTDAVMNHRIFATSTLYDPFLYSGIQNVYQNCFNPASSQSCTGSPNCCSDKTSQQDCVF